MAQTAEECLAFLREARDALDELSLLTDREGQLKQEEGKLERDLELEKKQMADAIQQTIKKRRGEIHSSYEKEMSRNEDQLKKVRGKREKAKNQGIKERIADETSSLHNDVRDRKLQLKTLIRQHHMPWYCGTKLYYGLFFPRRIKDYLWLLLCVLLVFVALPWGIYLIVPDRKPLYLVGIYLVDILVFGGGYIAVSNRTKILYMETLREGRRILDEMYISDHQIRRRTREIRRDRNEAIYNLEKFDDEIAQLQQELKDVADQKRDAINTFESVTKNIITDEIEHNYSQRIDQLQSDYHRTQAELKDVMAQVKEKRLYITNHYGSYLGKEYMDPLKVAELCAIVQRGEASNVSEAISVHKEQAKN